MTDDVYRRIRGIREPDPTLGKNILEPPAPPVVPVPAEPEQQSPKVRRQRVVLAEPSRAANTLRSRVELEEQTSWGEVLIKDLIKAQLWTAILLVTLVLVLLGSLPLVFYFSPTMANLHIIGLPVPWLLLGIAPFPLLFGVGLWYNRLAERHERDFVDMIEN